MAFYIWGNEATAGGVAGIFLVISGSAWYAWVQMQSATSAPSGTGGNKPSSAAPSK